MRRVLTSGLVLIVALGLAGCVEIVALAFSTAIGATGVYQRLEDRKTQKDQNEAIRELREELARTRKVLEQNVRSGHAVEKKAP